MASTLSDNFLQLFITINDLDNDQLRAELAKVKKINDGFKDFNGEDSDYYHFGTTFANVLEGELKHKTSEPPTIKDPPKVKKTTKRRKKTSTLRPPTFEVDDKTGWMNHLNEHGFTVIRDVISEEDATQAINTFKTEWCEVSPRFDWDDTTTWKPDNCPMVWNKSSVVYNGFGQSNSNWILRSKSRVKEVYSHIYGTNDLVTSYDGLSLFLSDKQKSQSWLHQDQRSNDNRLSVQAILNVLECDENDAGFVCVPDSHINYVAPPQDSDWVMLPKDDPNQDKTTKILTPPRSLILFHSKLIHANTGMKTKHPKGLHMNRFSSYTTFVPRERQSEEIRDQRIQGYHSGVSCSHWGDRFEPKKIPFHIRKRYLERGFNDLKPAVDSNGNIPVERLALI
jgi:ectoine hydroxylase-related dioxygenase (phytanoyl-CoA dioxygenase family)